MTDSIQLTANDGHPLDAYLNAPDSATAAVVVLQEIFGVNPHIRSVVDKFAAQGYWALAPALFDRARRGIELGYDAPGMEEGKKIAYGLNQEQILLDIDAALQYAIANVPSQKVAVVGYCFGGSYAWLSATRLRPHAAVCYYGSMIAKTADETPTCPVLMHFGRDDHGIPISDVDTIRRAHPEISIHVYEAGHGFSCDERASYAPEAAALAFSRTLAFLRETLAA